MNQENLIFDTVRKYSWKSLKEYLSKFNFNWNFRGQSNANWKLKNTIERIEFSKKSYLESEFLKKLDANIHNYDLKKYPNNTKQKLILLQHYGAPTRLIDFTSSPYVAAFFSLFQDQNNYTKRINNSTKDKSKYSAIYAIDTINIWSLLDNIASENYNKYITNNVKESLNGKIPSLLYTLNNNTAFENLVIGNEENLQFVVPIKPDFNDERTIPQASNFFINSDIHESFMQNLYSLITHCNSINFKHYFKKIIFPNKIRLEALSDLNKMNINKFSLFPNLDGFISNLYTATEIEWYELQKHISEQ